MDPAGSDHTGRSPQRGDRRMSSTWTLHGSGRREHSEWALLHRHTQTGPRPGPTPEDSTLSRCPPPPRPPRTCGRSPRTSGCGSASTCRTGGPRFSPSTSSSLFPGPRRRPRLPGPARRSRRPRWSGSATGSPTMIESSSTSDRRTSSVATITCNFCRPCRCARRSSATRTACRLSAGGTSTSARYPMTPTKGGSAAGRLTQPGDVMNRRRTLPKRIYGRPSRHSTTTAVSNMRANNKFRCPPLGDADFPYNTSHQRGFEGAAQPRTGPYVGIRRTSGTVEDTTDDSRNMRKLPSRRPDDHALPTLCQTE